MTRFELLVVVKIQLGDRALFRRCLAIEAAIEGVADVAGAAGRVVDATTWALLGLGAGIDLKLAAQNPEQEGLLAAELLRAEGFPRALADAARAARQDPVDALSEEALALAAAWALAPAILAAADDAGAIDAVEVEGVRRALVREDGGDRAVRAIDALDLDVGEVARAALARMITAREDLGR